MAAHANRSPSLNDSARGAQPRQGDCDEPVDRSLIRKVAGCCEGMEAVARKFVRHDIIPDVAGHSALGQHISDHVAQMLLRPGDLLVSVQERREFGVVVPAGLERRAEPAAR